MLARFKVFFLSFAISTACCHNYLQFIACVSDAALAALNSTNNNCLCERSVCSPPGKRVTFSVCQFTRMCNVVVLLILMYIYMRTCMCFCFYWLHNRSWFCIVRFIVFLLLLKLYCVFLFVWIQFKFKTFLPHKRAFSVCSAVLYEALIHSCILYLLRHSSSTSSIHRQQRL